MSNLINVLSIIMICFGIFMMLIGSIGIVRLPDFFCRIHATTKIDTVGILFCLGGFSIHEGITLTSLKLLTAIVFIGLSSMSRMSGNPSGFDHVYVEYPTHT